IMDRSLFVLLLLSGCLAGKQEIQNASKSIYFFSIGNTSYLIQMYKNWTDAQSYCRQQYTDLPTIHNSEENNQINQILLPGYYTWFGLFLDSWEWSDKWSRFFRHWAAGQPSQSSGTGDCVGMSRNNSGRWSQYSCDLKQPFICYGGEFPQQN
uniref:C-type lectin domain-containing protein n=1 Tax=Cyprinus carpio TaxID=7962 RepID=A0A8C1XPX6_CYPCA